MKWHTSSENIRCSILSRSHWPLLFHIWTQQGKFILDQNLLLPVPISDECNDHHQNVKIRYVLQLRLHQIRPFFFSQVSFGFSAFCNDLQINKGVLRFLFSTLYRFRDYRLKTRVWRKLSKHCSKITIELHSYFESILFNHSYVSETSMK